MKETILFVDNDQKALSTWSRLLMAEGYQVLTTNTVDEACEILNNNHIHLAIIDLRLEDDDDPYDTSGLTLVKDKKYTRIPKIILTAHQMDPQDINESLSVLGGELPPITWVASKSGDSKTLIETIRRTLETWPKLLSSSLKLSGQIKVDHTKTREQAHTYYRVTMVFSLLSIVVILAGIALAFCKPDQLPVSIVAAAGGILGEALSVLFFRRVDKANDRMDMYHRELLQTYWFDYLLTTCNELPDHGRDSAIQHLVTTATNEWLDFSQKNKNG